MSVSITTTFSSYCPQLGKAMQSLSATFQQRALRPLLVKTHYFVQLTTGCMKCGYSYVASIFSRKVTPAHAVPVTRLKEQKTKNDSIPYFLEGLIKLKLGEDGNEILNEIRQIWNEAS